MTAIDPDVTAIEDLARNFFAGDDELADDPYPTYEQLRRQCPVARSDRFGGFWVLSTYEDVKFVYQNPEIFSSNPVLVPPGVGQTRPLIPLEIDPPEHVKYRQILAPHFVPRKVAQLESEVRETVNRLIDGFIEDGHCDYISQFATPMPTEVFIRLMGWPVEHAPMFNDWTEKFVRGVPGDPEESQRVRGEAGAALYGYFAQAIADCRQERRDDITSALIDASYGKERPLSDEEILDIIFTLMIGGLDTTYSILGTSMSYLAQHPEIRDRLTADPGLIPTAVEEFLRWESPTAPGRKVTRDVTVRGNHFKAGDLVVILTGSAGRDEMQFDRANEIVLDRKPNKHLGFGDGAHRCLGAGLGQLELRVAFEELHRRIPDYHLANEPIVRHNGHIRGVDRLVLNFTPGRRLDH